MRAVLVGAMVMTIGCSKATTVPSWVDANSGQAAATIASVRLQPRGLFGGDTTRATLTLAAPAASASTITLASSDPFATVPPSVTVPAGSASVDFTVATRAVPSDTVATISATLAGQTFRSVLAVWRDAASTFAYELTSSNASVHYTGDAVPIAASCAASRVEVSVNNSDWDLDFSAPDGTPLRAGTYSGVAPGSSTNRPGLSLFSLTGQVPSCFAFGATGQFVVQQVSLRSPSQVLQFIATFQMRCADGTTINGAVKVNNPPQITSTLTCRT